MNLFSAGVLKLFSLGLGLLLLSGCTTSALSKMSRIATTYKTLPIR